MNYQKEIFSTVAHLNAWEFFRDLGYDMVELLARPPRTRLGH